MEKREFGKYGPVSVLTIGGGGIGQVWGETTREESVATLKASIDSGIDFIDVAPLYGRGEAERVVGEAFGGKLPDGVRLSTKCLVGTLPASDVHPKLERSLVRSFEALKRDHADLFVVHSNLCPDDYIFAENSENQDRWATRWSCYVDGVIPAMEKLMADGLIGGWGITGTGLPQTIIQALGHETPPHAVQAVANLMDTPGEMRNYDAPAEPRNIIAAAKAAGVGVMGIRAVAAGALTDAIDRPLPEGHRDAADYEEAAPFRALCAELGEKTGVVAHRYALGIDGVDTLILGVKNREELADCVEAAERGPLEADVLAKIEALGLRGA